MVKEDEYLPLARMLAEGFNTTPEYWLSCFSMWWETNPCMNPEIPKGWVCENEHNEMVGFVGNIPVKYLLHGDETIAFAGTTWFVKPKVRGGTVSNMLLEESYRNPLTRLFFVNSPNPIAQKRLMKLGFLEAPLPQNGIQYIHIRHPDNTLQLFLGSRTFARTWYRHVLRLVSWPLSLFSPAVVSLHDRRGRAMDGFECEVIRKPEESFSQLWKEFEREEKVTLVRDRAMVDWLCFSDLVKEKRYLIACREGGKLAGYAVFDLRIKRDQKVLFLMDLFVPGLRKEIIQCLVRYAGVLARDVDAAAVIFWANQQEVVQILERRFKIRLNLGVTKFYYKIEENDPTQDRNLVILPSLLDPDYGAV